MYAERRLPVAGGDAIHDDLAKLRKGPALQGRGLLAKVGPNLSAACGILRTDADKVVRQKVTKLVTRFAAALPPYLAQAIQVALGLEPDAGYPRLDERQSWLATEQKISPRTARRRVEEATARLADAISESTRDNRIDDLEEGWYFSRLRALLSLERPEAELIEERSIVATRDQVARIATRFSLPRPDQADPSRHELVTDVLHGARLRAVERLGTTHFRHVLDLPEPLRPGQEMSYVIRYRIPSGQRMIPHYAFVPLMPCGSFDLRVRFNQRQRRQVVWRLDRVAPRELEEGRPGPVLLTPDRAGDLSLEFADLLQGYAYGVAWRPDSARAEDDRDGGP